MLLVATIRAPSARGCLPVICRQASLPWQTERCSSAARLWRWGDCRVRGVGSCWDGAMMVNLQPGTATFFSSCSFPIAAGLLVKISVFYDWSWLSYDSSFLHLKIDLWFKIQIKDYKPEHFWPMGIRFGNNGENLTEIEEEIKLQDSRFIAHWKQWKATQWNVLLNIGNAQSFSLPQHWRIAGVWSA